MKLLITAWYWLRKTWWRVTGTKTSGAQMFLLKNDQVLLIKPSYKSTWSLPGGGVEKGETFEVAAIREAWEEAAVVVNSCEFFYEYVNRSEGRYDLVKVFKSEDWSQSPWKSSWEIEDKKMFNINNLPENVSKTIQKLILKLHSPSSIL